MSEQARVNVDARNNIRQAVRQIEAYMEDGQRERLTVALAILDSAPKAESHSLIPDGRGQGMRCCADCGLTEPTDAQPCNRRCSMRHDGSGRCYRAYRHSGPCKFRRNGGDE